MIGKKMCQNLAQSTQKCAKIRNQPKNKLKINKNSINTAYFYLVENAIRAKCTHFWDLVHGAKPIFPCATRGPKCTHLAQMCQIWQL
jgi:hypothetical protein